ncbi:MarR family transcriptional regulator [Aeromicrobium sp. YIM 150415]|uniref:MarR family winged helix-turn-helix transcriptional regulator n=1 Tax=Aeromicrobium sp. YIM 150415 TaxID=2803912 RepID=UPI0019635349|nr:MarR family transcriptional regulator [Aeromicrobium sp. YIM 150415]MBM9463663.1 MarR family transcriptional regulator [Aeromicrobium sp. YIM 150415]
MSEPLAPDALADRLTDVYVALGPVYRKVARIVERDQQIMGMSVGVRNVLDQLQRQDDLTVPQMARAQDLSRQFVQRMVNDARSSGFVEIVDNPAHRRSSLVRLTPNGQRAIDAVTGREHHMMGQVGGDLTAADLDATLRVLHHMRVALEAIEADTPT